RAELGQATSPHLRHPDADEGSADGDRGQHGMHPDATGKPNVDTRGGLVDVPPTQGDQPNGEVSNRPFRESNGVVAPKAVTPVNPEAALLAVNKEVGDLSVDQVGTERATFGGEAQPRSCRLGVGQASRAVDVGGRVDRPGW